tara:strand:- start:750 stop:1184 length:435 start_codon:yes stop_codon:yes gene_type:complete
LAVTFINNWKNISDSLQSKFRSEFGGTLAVYIGEGDHAGNHFLKILPKSNEVLERYSKGEVREYTFQLIYYFMEANVRKSGLVQMLRSISRIESLTCNNRSLTLADNTSTINGRIDNYEIVEGNDGFEYLVEMNYKCMHLGNLT